MTSQVELHQRVGYVVTRTIGIGTESMNIGSQHEPTELLITRHVVWTVIEYVGVFIVLFYLRHVWTKYASERNHLCECLGAKDPSLGSNDGVRHSVYSQASRFGDS